MFAAAVVTATSLWLLSSPSTAFVFRPHNRYRRQLIEAPQRTLNHGNGETTVTKDVYHGSRVALHMFTPRNTVNLNHKVAGKERHTIEELEISLKKEEQMLGLAQTWIEKLEENQTELLSKIIDLESSLEAAKQDKLSESEKLLKSEKDLADALEKIKALEAAASQRTVAPPAPAPAPAPAPPKPKPKPVAVARETIPEISDWKMTGSGGVTGIVTGHPSIDDGDEIMTSPLANPRQAAEKKIVVTKSGSKYKLGAPMSPFPSAGAKKSTKQKTSAEQARDEAKFRLTGETVGDGKYLLAGKPKKSTNGRCFICTVYRSDDDMEPYGEPLAMKVSANKEAMKREYSNFKKVWSGVQRGFIVECSDFLPVADSSVPRFADKSGIVMTLGTDDLKAYRQKSDLDGDTLRNAIWSSVKCIEAVHSARLVWTDLKTENLIRVEDTDGSVSFKGIDLESALPVKGNPVDYTPEACPPEFARAFAKDEGSEFVLEYSYDIWSLGVLAYELSTGRGFFDGWTPENIMKGLIDFEPNVELVEDEKLADMISQCLALDPKKRPQVQKIIRHPYFNGMSKPNLFGW